MSTMIERRTEGLPLRLVDWFDDFLPWTDRGRFTDMIRVEESVDHGVLTIRAEMPGIDPDKDVDITISDGVMTITAERRSEETKTEDGKNGRHVTRSEFKYGSFVRRLAVPKECKVSDTTATYRDGILTVTVPMPKAEVPPAVKVPVSRQ